MHYADRVTWPHCGDHVIVNYYKFNIQTKQLKLWLNITPINRIYVESGKYIYVMSSNITILQIVSLSPKWRLALFWTMWRHLHNVCDWHCMWALHTHTNPTIEVNTPLHPTHSPGPYMPYRPIYAPSPPPPHTHTPPHTHPTPIEVYPPSGSHTHLSAWRPPVGSRWGDYLPGRPWISRSADPAFPLSDLWHGQSMWASQSDQWSVFWGWVLDHTLGHRPHMSLVMLLWSLSAPWSRAWPVYYWPYNVILWLLKFLWFYG